MRALIAKEWRENRWLILGFVVVAPLLSIGLKWGIVSWKETDPIHSIKIVIPILTLLYVLAIAADLIASDAASGRIGFLFALPVRPAGVWAAKAMFLLGGAALFIIYLLILEMIILALAGKVVADLFTPYTLRWMFLLVPVAVVGAATMATSALVDRGLAAAILALLFVGGIIWAASLLDGWGVNLKPDGTVFYVIAALVGGGFLLASLTATTLGRIHLGARFRRVALAAAAFFLVILPPTAWAGARVHRWLHIEPDQKDIRIRSILDVDPAGEWALVVVGRPGNGPAGVKGAPFAEWAVNLEDGTVRDLTELGLTLTGMDTWSEGPGRAVVYRSQPDPERRASIWLRVVCDLAEGKVVSTRPIAPDAPNPMRAVRRGPLLTETNWDSRAKERKTTVHREGREPIEISGDWTMSATARDWGLLVYRRVKNAGMEYGLLMTATGEIRPIAAWPGVLPSAPDGHGWTLKTSGTVGRTDCRIDRIPLDGSPVETIVAGKGKANLTRDGTRALAYIDGRAFWLDADADEPLELPAVRFEDPEPRIHWSADGRIAVASDGESAYRITATAAGPEVEPIPPPPAAAWPELWLRWFDGERWLAKDNDQSRLLLYGMDGSERQLLPIPEESRR